jgi:ATP-binding cassette subfamily B protein
MHGPGPGPRAHFEKPKDASKTAVRLLSYLKSRTLTLCVVLVLVLLSTGAMLAGSYFLKPLINDYILPGDFAGLARSLVILAGIYLIGAAASYAQSWLMIRVAQGTTNVLRRDLFAKLQTLPLRYSDSHPHGELMTASPTTSTTCRWRSTTPSSSFEHTVGWRHHSCWCSVDPLHRYRWCWP